MVRKKKEDADKIEDEAVADSEETTGGGGLVAGDLSEGSISEGSILSGSLELESENTEQEKPILPMVVNGQYIKDFSFESPGAPGIFARMHKQQPNIEINVDVKAKNLKNNAFEVILLIRAECKVGEETAFMAELSYGGMFTINVSQENLESMLLIEAPRMLFPFARNVLADATRDGGFPPLMLGVIDFTAMYQRRQRHQVPAA